MKIELSICKIMECALCISQSTKNKANKKLL